MNTILSVLVLISAVYLRLRYRPTGADAAKLFAVTVMSAIIVGLAITGSSVLLSIIVYLVDIALCGIILFLYRLEIQQQVAKKARRRAAARAAMREVSELRAAEAAKRPLSCFAAFTEQDTAPEYSTGIAA